MTTQINLNATPLTPGVIQIFPIADSLFPGVVQAEINADPLYPGVVQANLNFDPRTPSLVFVNFNSTAATTLPVNTALPTISGTAQNGQTLTATNGTWTNSPASYAYQWKRAGVPIAGATASTYVPVQADVGSTLTVSVTATNASGSGTATSAPTSAVIDIAPTINTAASIPGTPQVGTPITAIDAIWNYTVTSRAYQWKVAGVNGTGAGATTLTYTPAAGDLGSTLTITVTATNSGGTSAPSTSAASAAVIAASGTVNLLLLGLVQ
jgi:hypothetical protein